MQATSTFGKRGREPVITKPSQSPTNKRAPPSEARKLITFGLGFTVVMFAAGGLLFALVMLLVAPDVATRVTASGASASSAISQAALTEGDKVELQMARASAICEGLNRSGLGTAPCEVAGASIIIHSNSSVAHAQMLCSEAVRAVRASGATFEGKWTMYIKGPYTGSQSLAYCRLP